MRALLIIGSLLPMSALAVPVTFELEVTRLHTKTGELFESADRLLLRYTYEPDTPDQLPDDPTRGRYDTLTSLSLFVDDLELVGHNFGLVNVGNDFFVYPSLNVVDNFGLSAQVSGAGYEFNVSFYSLYLDGPPPGLWTSDALPISSPLTVSPETHLLIYLPEQPDVIYAAGYANRWEQVPEPAPLALLRTGLLGLLLFRRRA